ncbi:hypothetical protein D3C72_1193490 [compost metagenome]
MTLRDRIEMVLGLQRVARGGAAQADADDSPPGIALRQGGFGVQRLVGAVEYTQTQMHDAPAQAGAIVARTLDPGTHLEKGFL